MKYVDAASRYKLGPRIATGGMGEVWRATDTVLGREVAIKLLKAEYADDPLFRARFEEEARHAAALHHPNVAAIFDIGESPAPDGGAPRPFLVMELVEGQPLSALLGPRSPMPPDRAAGLIAQAADGVAVAHRAKIVHRDLKPANLLVTPDGRVKITDFGIARAADGLALTHTGQVLGTPHYLSPEQAEGRKATKASDVYSLGVVLFECLAGKRPFEGEGPVATALSHLRDPVPDLPASVPAALQAVVHRALAKDPSDRFADAAVFATALRAAMGAPDSVAPTPVAPPTRMTTRLSKRGTPETQVLTPAPVPAPVPAPATAKKKRRWWWLLPVAALLAVGGYLGYDALSTHKPPGTPVDTGFSLTRSDFVGHRLVAVTRALTARGLDVVPREVENPDRRIPKVVSDVTPLTGLHSGDIVVVSYWGPRPNQHSQNPSKSPSQSESQSPSQNPSQQGDTGKGHKQ